MAHNKKPKAPAKPAAPSFAQIGGALPPPPTAAELKAERARRKGAGNLYVPNTAKAKAVKPKRAGVTGINARRRMADEAMGG